MNLKKNNLVNERGSLCKTGIYTISCNKYKS